MTVIVDTKALQLASRFALPPNSLGYCGKGTAPAKFIVCAINGKCKGINKEISRFIVLNPYLETLSAITGLDKFSYPVVEAYCLGNDELNKAKPNDYSLLLKNFNKQGVPEWLIDELKQNIPTEFIPIHLFQVLFVGVGKASGSVPYNIETINNCMIRWGKVKKIDDKRLYVKLNSLKEEKGGYALQFKDSSFSYRGDFVPGIKVGSTIAIHWKQVIKVLTTKEVSNLEYWTKRVLNSLYSRSH